MAGIGFAVERLYPHLFHQGGEMLAAHLLLIQPLNMSRSILGSANGRACMEFIDFPHQSQISSMLDVAHSRGCYGLDAAVCSFELMGVGGGG